MVKEGRVEKVNETDTCRLYWGCICVTEKFMILCGEQQDLH